MGYIPLCLSDTPPLVYKLMQVIEKSRLSDVHTMLRLPLGEHGLNAGCNFAITQVLLCVIGGVSVTLYEPKAKTVRGDDRKRFTGVLKEYYPWDQEPIEICREVGSAAIYEVFRNPLTHDLGLDIPNKRRGSKLYIKRLSSSGSKGLSESFIETQLERQQRWVGMSPTLKITNKTQTLLVEGLYWGVRRMIENLSADKRRMQEAEKFLKELR